MRSVMALSLAAVVHGHAHPTGLSLVSRFYAPYGDGESFAFGMGAGEKAAFDPVGKDCLHGIRAGSAPHPALQLFTPTATHPRHRRMQGFLNAVSYANPSAPHLLKDHALGFGRSLTDASICGGILAVAMPAAVKTDPGPRLSLPLP